MSRYTTLQYLNFGPALELDGKTAIMWLISRIEDERDENRAYDHWHPEIGVPLDDLMNTLKSRLGESGVEFEWIRPDASARNHHMTSRA